jgi:hypothetical protein
LIDFGVSGYHYRNIGVSAAFFFIRTEADRIADVFLSGVGDSLLRMKYNI